MWSNLKWKLMLGMILIANTVQPSQRNRELQMPSIKSIMKTPIKPVLTIPTQRVEAKRVVSPLVVVTPTRRVPAPPIQSGWLKIILMILLVVIGGFLLFNLNLFNSQKSPYFNVIFDSLSPADQTTINTFKQGPHSWILNSTHTGVIISDLIVNNQLVGLRLIFDNHQNIYLTYHELLNLYKFGAMANFVNLSLPDRSLSQNSIIDSNVNSYEITFTANMNLFSFQYMATKATPSISYEDGGITTTVSANS